MAAFSNPKLRYRKECRIDNMAKPRVQMINEPASRPSQTGSAFFALPFATCMKKTTQPVLPARIGST